MRNKYYTPEIEELFQYIIKGETLYGEVYGTSNLLEIEGQEGISNFINFLYTNCSIRDNKLVDLDETLFRIKYLDKEDIESFGLQYIGGKLNGTTLQEFSGKINKGYYLHITSTEFSDKNVITIKTSVYENSVKTLVVHTISIKNKTELKTLLKQLGII